ncbi:MAG: peptidase M50, partial [Actinomycetales bacterium]|nr:peptidase M50 [Actinomycetales bacterium]
LLVAGFNLVPGLPLDGGQLLAALVWKVTGRQHTGTVAAAWVGRALAVGLVAWALGRPLVSGRTPDTFTLVWTLVVAVAVWSGASGALRQAVSQERASRLTVESTGRAAIALPRGATAAEAAHGVRAAGTSLTEVVLVDESGAPVAYVDRAALDAVPPAALEATPAWSVAAPVRPGAVIDANLEGQDLLMALVMAFRVQPVVVALRDGAPVALVVDAEVARQLQR